MRPIRLAGKSTIVFRRLHVPTPKSDGSAPRSSEGSPKRLRGPGGSAGGRRGGAPSRTGRQKRDSRASKRPVARSVLVLRIHKLRISGLDFWEIPDRDLGIKPPQDQDPDWVKAFRFQILSLWIGLASPGLAWPGLAWPSMARHGTARHGTARHGTARHGTA